jgi:hypothetical protein
MYWFRLVLTLLQLWRMISKFDPLLNVAVAAHLHSTLPGCAQLPPGSRFMQIGGCVQSQLKKLMNVRRVWANVCWT